MKKWASIICLAFLLSSPGAQAQDREAARRSAETLLAAVLPPPPANHSPIAKVNGQVFVGCARSNYECYNMARSNGYEHHQLLHDHGRCPASPGLACYGYNQ